MITPLPIRNTTAEYVTLMFTIIQKACRSPSCRTAAACTAIPSVASQMQPSVTKPLVTTSLPRGIVPA
jgi:hypothetical protein